LGDFEGEEDVDPFQGNGAVDVEEVHGQDGRGLHTQERRQDVSVDRSGAGGIRRSLRIRRIVDAPTR
jgi:hypothetical protein